MSIVPLCDGEPVLAELVIMTGFHSEFVDDAEHDLGSSLMSYALYNTDREWYSSGYELPSGWDS